MRFLFFSLFLFGCSISQRDLFLETSDIQIIKCVISVNPKEREIIDRKHLTNEQISFFYNLQKDGEDVILGFVSCKYYLVLDNKNTIGIILDENKNIYGFDYGKRFDSINTPIKAYRKVRKCNTKKKLDENFFRDIFESK